MRNSRSTRWSALVLGLALVCAGCGTQASVPPQTTQPTDSAAAPTAAAAPTTVAPTAAAPAAAPTTSATAPAAPTTTPAASSPQPGGVLTRTLTLQDPPLNGEDVRSVQQRLLDLGYGLVGDTDGLYGPQTEAAVRVFQLLNGLEVDGVLGPETWARLNDPGATPAEAVVPVVNASLCGGGLLLGAVYGDVWLDNEQAGGLLSGSRSYRLFSSAGQQGVLTGAAPKTEEEPPIQGQYNVELSPEPEGDDLIAIGGSWNPVPRTPAPLPAGTDLAPYRTAVTEALKTQGVDQPGFEEAGVFEVVQVDLDGDGAQEAIVTAERLGAPGAHYSLVLLRYGTTAPKTSLLAADIRPEAPSDFDKASHRLFGVFDLNGDGRLEVITKSSYFESAADVVHSLENDAVTERMRVFCGV
ncbi:MAG TPA: peptidoglycan-binding domain-containing protein [Roseiflexaceae bacterium]|nr:peptidoglycan-binding domain-containing protein [Roseiflexaceae bacterium]